jgi:hypothetical protein
MGQAVAPGASEPIFDFDWRQAVAREPSREGRRVAGSTSPPPGRHALGGQISIRSHLRRNFKRVGKKLVDGRGM